MKQIVVAAAMVISVFVTSCSRVNYQESPATDKSVATPVHNANNIFN